MVYIYTIYYYVVRGLSLITWSLLLLPGTDHIALNVDVTNSENVQTTFKNVTQQFSKPPTIVVNSAGITRDNFILKLSDSDFDAVIDVNLKGTFLIIQTAAKAMIEADATKGSSIINVSSIMATFGNIGQSNYGASKAGVLALTKTASREFGKCVIG